MALPRRLTFGSLLPGENYSAKKLLSRGQVNTEVLDCCKLKFLTAGVELLSNLAIENGMPITKDATSQLNIFV